MIHIIGLILKITGSVLLGVLAMVIGILLFVLFSAIRYQIDGEKNGKPKGRVKITWLLRILSVNAVYQEALLVQVKLLGRTVWKLDGRLNQEKPPDAAGGKEPGPIPVPKPANAEEREDFRPKEEAAAKEEFSPGAAWDREASDPSPDQPAGKKVSDTPDKGFNRIQKAKDLVLTWIRKLRQLIENLQEKKEQIQGKISRAQEKWEWAREKWETVMELAGDPANRKSLQLILKQLKKIIRHPLPRKGQGDITFGLEEPCQMGQVLSAAALLYPFTHSFLTLHPVFNEKVLEGEIHVKGRIRLGVMFGYVLRLLFDGNIRKKLFSLIRFAAGGRKADRKTGKQEEAYGR